MKYYFCNTFGSTSEDGIYRIDLEQAEVFVCAPLKNLEWVCSGPDGIFYAAGQEEREGSYLQAFRLEPLSKAFISLERKHFPWRGISHMSFCKEESALLIAVYGESMAVSVEVRDGAIIKETGRTTFRGSGPIAGRQETSHPHFIKRMEEVCWIADLGSDAIYYSNRFPFSKQQKDWKTKYVAQGVGPRFLEMDPCGRNVYLLTELSNELIVLEKTAGGGLKEKQRMALLTEGEKESLASILYPDWKRERMFVGIRGANLIKELLVQGDGILREGRIFHTFGWPRSFLYVERTDSLLVADEEWKESVGMLEYLELHTGKCLWKKRLPHAYQVYEEGN